VPAHECLSSDPKYLDTPTVRSHGLKSWPERQVAITDEGRGHFMCVRGLETLRCPRRSRSDDIQAHYPPYPVGSHASAPASSGCGECVVHVNTGSMAPRATSLSSRYSVLLFKLWFSIESLVLQGSASFHHRHSHYLIRSSRADIFLHVWLGPSLGAAKNCP
jgi:hypothetical protein